MLNFNRSITTFGLLALTLLAAPKASALAILDTAVYLGHTYHLLEAASWVDSEAAAIALGGHLVAINDEFENEFVRSHFGEASGLFTNRLNLWIGLNDVAIEGLFVWSNGDALTYENWVLNEPNDCSPTPSGCISEEYVHMPWWASGLGQWNDVPEQPTFHFGVVEIEPSILPEPTSLLLLGLGLAAVVRARQTGA
jgi:hypothetical protein